MQAPLPSRGENAAEAVPSTPHSCLTALITAVMFPAPCPPVTHRGLPKPYIIITIITGITILVIDYYYFIVIILMDTPSKLVSNSIFCTLSSPKVLLNCLKLYIIIIQILILLTTVGVKHPFQLTAGPDATACLADGRHVRWIEEEERGGRGGMGGGQVCGWGAGERVYMWGEGGGLTFGFLSFMGVGAGGVGWVGY